MYTRNYDIGHFSEHIEKSSTIKQERMKKVFILSIVLCFLAQSAGAVVGWHAIKMWNDRQPKKSVPYSDEEIVNAIYKAEGGSEAQYLYGIRSCSYDTPAEARRICFNTVRNNRARYADYGHKQFDTYLEFLASRYCPIGADNDPKGLNKNWLKNVKFFLEEGRK